MQSLLKNRKMNLAMRYLNIIVWTALFLISGLSLTAQNTHVDLRMTRGWIRGSMGDGNSSPTDPEWKTTATFSGSIVAAGEICRYLDNYCFYNPNVFPPITCPNEQTYNDVFVTYNGNPTNFSLADGFLVTVNLEAWEEDGPSPECHYGGGDDAYGTASTSFYFRIPTGATFPYTYDFTLAVSDNFEVDYRLTVHNIDAINGSKLRYANTAGNTQSSFCGGSTVRMYADRHAGYNGGYFEWQKLVNGNWVSATPTQFSTSNYLEFPANTTMPQVRVRVARNCSFFCFFANGTGTSDGWIDNSGVAINVAPAPPALADIVTTPVGACSGNSNGSIQVTVNNANSASQYSLTLLNSNNVVVANATPPMGSTLMHTFSGLSAGSYKVKVGFASSNVDCTTEKSGIVVPSLPLPTISTAAIAGNCFGNNGSITVTIAQNAAGTNTFSLLNAAGSSTISTFNTANSSHTFSVAAGTYQVRVTNGNSCNSALSGAIVVPNAPSAVNALVALDNFAGFQISCNGGSGNITITPSGGTPPYSIAVDGGGAQASVPAGSPRVFSRAAGSYNYTVTDNKGCVFSGSVNLTQPPALIASTSNLQPATDCGAVGSATLNGTGGAPPYQYSLASSGPFGSSNVFNGLAAGNHTGYIRDAAGCQVSTPFTISAPNPLLVSPLTVVNTSCSGSSNGAVTLEATGGNPPYQFRIGSGAFSSQSTYSNLAAGVYTFEVRDAVFCTNTVNVDVSSPNAIQITNHSLGFTSCDGLDRPFTISFTGRADGILNFFDNGLEVSTDNGATYNAFAEIYDDGQTVQVGFILPVGNYQVIIRDAAGCISNTHNVAAPAEPPLFLNIAGVTPETCAGAHDGTISVNFGGGQGTYYLRLLRIFESDGIFEVANFGPVSAAGSHTFANLAPTNDGFHGGYLVQVIDAYDPMSFSGNCNVQAPQVNFPIPPGGGINIGAASPFNAGTAQSTGPLLNCYGNNGVITVSGTSGGEAPYQYSIDGVEFQSGNVFTGVGAQTNIYVRDNRGCTVGPQTVNIASAPVTLNTTATLLQPETNCTLGSIQVGITGGTAPFEYALRTAGCDGQYEFATAATGTFVVSDLSADNYTFCVRDAGGCVDEATISIPQIDPPGLTVTNVQNTTCFNGGNNGAITLQASGGTAPYTVRINNINPQTGNSNFTFSNLSPGNYLFTLTDAKGCTTFIIQSVATTNEIFAEVNADDIFGCNGGQNGSIQVVPYGGVAPYTIAWLWDNTSITNVGENQMTTRSGLPAGVYNILITDAQGCQRAEIEVIEQPQGIFATIQVANALCSNVPSGTALVNAVGGTAPYEYSLNAGPYQPDNFYENLAPGTYSVIVRDANSCFSTFNFVIGVQRVLSATATPTPAACFGQSSGSIAIGVSGGGTPYNFSVNNGPFSTANPITGLAAGTYSVLIEDNGGCEFTLNNIQITQPSQLTATVNVLQNASCAQNSGILQAQAAGGTPGYTYQWNGNSSQTNPTLNNAPPGLNTVIITDNRGCTATASATVTNIPPLSLNLAGTTNERCDQANGTATVAPQGGTAPISYSWSHNTGLNSPTATGLAAGSYSVTATDANNCTASLTLTVLETQGPGVTLAVTNSFCTNGTGSITATPTGGLPPYMYTWSHNAGLNSPTANNLTAGNYTVTVTDANNCSASVSGTVQFVPPPTGNAVVTLASCQGNNGAIQVAISGGTAPFVFSWSHNPSLTTGIATGLVAGNYSYTITDGGNCTFSGTATVGEQPPPQVTINAQTATCGSANGTATATVNGGTAPYTYTWSNNSPNNPQANNLAPGSYTLTLTDAFGCQDVETFTIQNIPGPSALNLVVQNTICTNFNGGITATPVGGNGPYTYSWSHNALLNSPNAAPLPAGNYSVTATDANGCSIMASATVVFQPPPLIQTLAVQNSVCTNGNGSIEIEAQGTGPYTYQWTNQVSTGPVAQNLNVGSYTVTVTDGAGCSSQKTFSISLAPGASLQVLNAVNDRCSQGIGSIRVRATGGATPYTWSWSHNTSLNSDLATGLTAGSYTVSVTDGNGCTTTLTRVLTDLPGVTLNPGTISPAFCGNPVGQITVQASGGVGPYTYTWSHNAGLNSNTASGLAPGEYGVTVTDGSNCTAQLSFPIASTPVPELTLASATEAPCLSNDGTITVAASGGIGTYNYSWSHNAGLNSPTASGLGSGTYSVTATDVNGCSATLSETITDRQPPILALGTITGSTCGTSDGSISVTGSGGQLPYTYSWSHNAGLNNALADNLAAGAYSVTLTDGNGCTAVLNANVSDTQAPQATVQYNDARCAEGSGSISISITGGTAPFDYNWSHDPGATGPVVTNLNSGSYSLTLTDAAGCQAIVTQAIAYLPPPVVSAEAENSLCNDGNGTVTLDVSGGTLPYTYAWSHDPGLQFIQAAGLNAGNYSVVVTDDNGCTASAQATVALLAAPQMSLSAIADAYCGANNGSISVNVSGGAVPYTYNWSHDGGLNAPMAGNLPADDYSISATDANGCVANLIATVEDDPGLVLSANVQATTCGNSNGSVTISVANGVAPFQYAWSHDSGLNAPLATNLPVAPYTVSVTDAAGCQQIFAAVVQASDGPNLSVINQQDASCGDNNGLISVAVSGGSAPYTYSWSQNTSLNAATAINLAGGTYRVTVTDASGCQGLAIATLMQGEAPVVQLLSLIETACSQPTGSIAVSAFNGESPYTYSWSHNAGLNAPMASSLQEGAYSVTVTDALGCEAALNAVILNQNTDLELILATSANALCASASGSAMLEVQNGIPSYSYVWSHDPLLIAETAGGLAAGPYSATVTDALGCHATLAFSIGADNPALSLAVLDNQPSACNTGTGTVTVNPVSGQAPYTYSWSHDAGETDATATGLFAGTYDATVTDANGCAGTIDVTVAQTPDPQVVLANQTDTDCAQNTGSLSVLASGGSAPYAYAWSHSAAATTEEAANLGAGNYTVTITDANGCTTTLDATVSSLGAPQATINTTDSYCNQPSGAATATVTEAGVFTYAWENTANPGTVIDSDDTAGNLEAGVYAVTITNQAGCERVLLANVQDLPDMVLSVNVNDVACFGEANGSAGVLVNSGGTAPFTYQWSTNSGDDNIMSQPAGTYSVTVTDDHGCTAESTVVINEPPVLSLALVSTIQPDCGASVNGSISVQANGGQLPYTYTWDSGQTTAAISGLDAGNYSLTLTDGNGCTETLQTTLQAVGDLDITVATTSPDCVDGNNGAATATVTGGGSFTYLWNAPGTPSGSGISGLPAGDYQVTVSNGSGCASVASFTVSAPPALSLQLSAEASCLNALNGSATAAANGGANGFTYEWSTMETGASIAGLLPGFYTVTATDANGCAISDGILVDGAPFPTLSVQSIVPPDCINITGTATVLASGGTGAISYLWNDPSAQSSATATALSPGNYSVTATDENGCSGSVDVAIEQPDDLIVNLSNLESPSCNGDADATATVTVLNGTGTYTYLWSDPQGQITPQAVNLAAGDYIVTVSDTGNGCATTLTVTVPETPVVTINLQNATAPLCFGENNGSATVLATGGTAPFDYLWNDPNAQATNNAVNLPAGDYTVSVTDDNGCTAALAVSVPEAVLLEATISNFTTPLCFGENTATATVSATGGAGNYTYLWDDPLLQNTAAAANLTAGDYTVIVSDANGCQTTALVTISQTPQVILTTEATISPSCTGFSDGSITVAGSGGTGVLSYLWSNDETTAQANNLNSGSYSVTVMDANGCTASQDIVLTDAVALLISGSTFTLPGCFNSPDGSITITPQGGSGVYEYLWSDPSAQSGATATNLSSGSYSVTLTDSNGCFVSETYTLTSNAPQIFINGNLTAPACDGATNGSIALTVTGGAGGFSYAWQGGQTGNTLGSLAPGDYTVNVTDAQGCSEQATFSLPEGVAFAIELGSTDTSLCFGEVLYVDFSGLNYQTQWTSSNGFSSQDATVRLESSGVYMVEVTNEFGCVARDTISVQAGTEPLQAHFVTPTDVLAGEEVVVVEVSWPVPDEVNWIFDPALATLVEQRGDQYIFTFPTPGQVPLTLQAISGDCADWLTKTITVHADNSTIPSPGPVQELLAFRLMPNPTSGVFRVEVELSVAREIVLSIFDITGNLKDRRVRSGQAIYSEDYVLGLEPGAHIVILQTPSQRKSLVFTVVAP